MLGEQRSNPRPVLLRHVAIADDATDQGAGLFAALMQQMDDRQRDLAFAQIAADRLADRFGLAGEVEEIVDELKHHPQIESILAQRELLLFADFAEHAADLRAAA